MSDLCHNHVGIFLGASPLVFQGMTNLATLNAWACGDAFPLAFELQQRNMQVASNCLHAGK